MMKKCTFVSMSVFLNSGRIRENFGYNLGKDLGKTFVFFFFFLGRRGLVEIILSTVTCRSSCTFTLILG